MCALALNGMRLKSFLIELGTLLWSTLQPVPIDLFHDQAWLKAEKDPIGEN